MDRAVRNRQFERLLAEHGPATVELAEAELVSDDGPTPEAMAVAAEGSSRLFAGAARLPLPLEQVMSLALEGLGPAEIGAVLGISEGNAAVRPHRGRSKLREWM